MTFPHFKWGPILGIYVRDEKGLVNFQSIRANWNKKISVIATEKPSLPPNRVFIGATFDFW